MTKQEFQKRIGAEISQKDYSIVEHVYTWHPSISEVEGKEQIADCKLRVGKYVEDNSVAVEIYNRWDGPIARVTTCLCDHSLAEDEAYVDTNNCPWAVALLEENGFAERTGRTRRSGYCEYPAMKFDRSKMAEFEEES